MPVTSDGGLADVGHGPGPDQLVDVVGDAAQHRGGTGQVHPHVVAGAIVG
ncbi:hypothetical protein ACIBI9_67075 [Nonomuraea sp. NPDC050451]